MAVRNTPPRRQVLASQMETQEVSERWGSHRLMHECPAAGHLATVRTVVKTNTASSAMPQDHCIRSKAGHSKDDGWNLTASSGPPPLVVEYGLNVLSLPVLWLARMSTHEEGGSADEAPSGAGAVRFMSSLWGGHQEGPGGDSSLPRPLPMGHVDIFGLSSSAIVIAWPQTHSGETGCW